MAVTQENHPFFTAQILSSYRTPTNTREAFVSSTASDFRHTIFHVQPLICPTAQQSRNAAASIATTVAPTGVPARTDARIPANAQTTESTAEYVVTAQNVWKTRMADSAGKITKAEIKSDPTRFIASTIMTAMMTASIRLYRLALTPTARAKS